ncbi:DUF2339 domain-containing protein [Actinomyces ruminicola]|uniref:Predicted membrane protein n=1 Tax=Actinomyces ruminicola TaxID=332524 RepID=A0A1G9UG79_9ACTO|nr:DUF2339 domain-containing protein [Actinomyces ruminicola]SDM58764.1 Predicted membrane protein [Actinomyces ruminicola]
MDTNSERLDEIIGRLACLERKVDWVAARVAPDETGARRMPAPAPSQPRLAPMQHTPPQPPPARSVPEASPARPRTPALAMYPPVGPVAKKPVALSQNGPTAAAPHVGSMSVTGAYPFATQPPQPQQERRREGNIGRYVLSGAAAFLIVSAAVSLIALVWDRIPDAVKVGTLGVIAVAMVASGTILVNRRERQRVTAATLTGTGGALGFVAIIGAALIAGLPSIAAFVLMVAWAFVLLLFSCTTGHFFTAVISMLGAMVTVGFAASQVAAHPEQATLTWMLIDLYVVALAAVAAAAPRFTPGMRLAPWLPSTSMVVTATVLLTGPSRLLLAQPLPGIVLLTVPCAVLLVQTHHSTRLLARASAGSVIGYEWAAAGIVQALAVLLLGYAEGVTASARNGIALVFLALACVSTTGLLPRTKAPEWLRAVAPVNLGTVTGIAATVFAVSLDLLPTAVAATALAAVPVVRLGYSTPVILIPLTGAAALVAGLSPARSALMLTVLAVLLAVALTAPLEALLAPPPPQSGESADRPTWLAGAAWVLAADLVLILPWLLDRLLAGNGGGEAGRMPAPLLAGAAALGLAGLGLFTSKCSPRILLSGGRAGRLEGAADLRTPLRPAPPPLAWLGDALLTVLGMAVLFRADSLGSPLLEAPLVAVALALVIVGGRMLLPWLRRAEVSLTIAASQSVALWWAVMILTGAAAASLLVTGVVLATGTVCIAVGFRLRAATLRHYGLTLVLLVVLKLAVVDLAGQNSLTRILALVVAGVVCFGLSLAYNHFAQEQAGQAAQTGPGASPVSSPLAAGPGRP